MDSLWSDIMQLTLLLLAGSVLRFILPYVIQGLTVVGEKNSLKAWPAWQWRYVTSIILAMITYGMFMLYNPEAVSNTLTLSPATIILLAYTGQDMASRLVKPFRDKLVVAVGMLIPMLR